jgi:phosphoglycerol transferase MdoB-like AlkP superfamily enzyme
VKYADYAIGRFLEDAKKQPWFRDTVFVIVADHCAASGGKVDLPVKRYEIPLLVYAPAHVRPRTVDTLMSQIDVAPTVLGILNMSYRTRFFGRDVLREDPAAGRAFISNNQKLGYLTDDRLVIVGPKQYLAAYSYVRKDGSVREMRPEETTVQDTLSYFQGNNYVYKHRLNRNN